MLADDILVAAAPGIDSSLAGAKKTANNQQTPLLPTTPGQAKDWMIMMMMIMIMIATVMKMMMNDDHDDD